MDDYKFIAREFLGRPDGALFYEHLPREESEWVMPRPLNRVEAVQHALKALKKAEI